MLDFNHKPKNKNEINETLNELIDRVLIEERGKEQERNYLGASQLGTACSRALQYQYKKTPKDEGRDFDPHILRIFATGHLYEELLIKWLTGAGFDLRTKDEQGNQFGFRAAGGKIAGHIDGIIYGAPKELNLSCPALLEIKTMNDKSWKDTVKKGLVLSKPVYAAQIALYQAYMETTISGISKNPCLLTAINKDTSELYHELIPFDAELAQRISDKAVNIVRASEAEELLPRLYADRNFIECKVCAWQDRCWGQEGNV